MWLLAFRSISFPRCCHARICCSCSITENGSGPCPAMNQNTALNPVLATNSMTVLSSGEIVPVSVARFDLDPIPDREPRDSMGPRGTGAVGGFTCEDAAEGRSPPSAYIDGVPVTVSVQNLDGQQRLIYVAADPSGGAESFVSPLAAEGSLHLQAGAGLLSFQSLPPTLQSLEPLDSLEPLQPLNPCLLLGGEQEPWRPDPEEPKKRKGGWPKGKKRKPQREVSAPRAPTTGYVIFVNEHKVRLRAENPDLPFTEITKMLGVHWSRLSAEDKQKYNTEAEQDKLRYIQELVAYQNTEAYKAFLRKKALDKAKDLCGMECDDSELEMEALALSHVDADDSSHLYCCTCKQYFSSLHNKKEHLLGRQHLQALTEEFEKETSGQHKASQSVAELEEEQDEDEEEETGLAHLCSLSSLELNVLEELLLRQINLRELELLELTASLDQAKKQREHLNSELQELEVRKGALEQELRCLGDSGAMLESQLNGLKMVPLMFQFHLDVLDRGVGYNL
ncbi:high mobility group protein 20A-like [Brienomyrus brachyistius]|uniref:high mobility group protein 20A-like n=1 Tax=Brienomyrus brachyistius TaxID=42636 RepID=UPI0020B300BA|nr:high mobility group protein 20A-like [Brienomyrus brachyistius]XP_048827250.1 high mobility group protein 20A-like [Brienomyrus brachyistius]XP_048827251.1 high mobility group protein 20A-like [Brienomyrus brachyistius]XP_048827252.1 high mobility group protein 20A-like [Brienomyrus brachyistius]XP_048827253.1 high mobility group protein 20A-like [Brienomyrus brachyistius]XP_048827254.1 high mobility group protein 20A-like [Brienomyrus brachyistius]XP_048827255.1 high mobility group protei